MLYRENYASALKQAATKLEHALFQIPLASLETNADIKSELFDLSSQLHHAKFEQRAAMAHQAVELKEALEQAYFESHKGTEEIRTLLRELIKKHLSNTEELKAQIDLLVQEASGAKKNKEAQMEFELNEVIAAISESLKDAQKAPFIGHNLESRLSCPITKEIMEDPVILVQSGVTYDRSAIEEWLSKENTTDPVTQIELTSGELVPNRTVKDICQSFMEESGSFSSTDAPQVEHSVSRIAPGVYEGRGKLSIGLEKVHATQLLILKPNGKVSGCSFYEGNGEAMQTNRLVFGRGELDNNTLKLSYKDEVYSYNGSAASGDNYFQSGIEWNGKVSAADIPNQEHGFHVVYSPPQVDQSIWSRPGILQIESNLSTSQNNNKYSSKAVVALEANSSASGCLWFESTSLESMAIGNIIKGTWDSDGSIALTVHFSLEDRSLNSKTKRKAHSVSYEITGSFIDHGKENMPTFMANIVKMKTKDAVRQGVDTSHMPFSDNEQIEYCYLSKASVPWYRLSSNLMELFQV
eukprot:g72.t1